MGSGVVGPECDRADGICLPLSEPLWESDDYVTPLLGHAGKPRRLPCAACPVTQEPHLYTLSPHLFRLIPTSCRVYLESQIPPFLLSHPCHHARSSITYRARPVWLEGSGNRSSSSACPSSFQIRHLLVSCCSAFRKLIMISTHLDPHYEPIAAQVLVPSISGVRTQGQLLE